MTPPTFKRWELYTGACAGTAGTAVVALGFAVGWPGPAVLLVEALMGLILALFLSMSELRRTLVSVRSRLAASPAGLCPRCEHPLPEGVEGFVTCPECGLNRERGEVDRDWSRWVDLPL